MKRTSFILLALAVVSLLGQGCRKSEEWPQAGAGRSIAFSPAVVGLQSPVEGSKSTLYNDESGIDMALEDCGLTSFNVSAWSEGNDPVVPAGTVISFAEDKWTSDTKYVWPEDATLHFYAYVPSDGLTESSISADGQVFNYSSAVVTERTDLLMGYYIGKGTAITNKVMGADICFGHPLGALVIKAGNFLKDLHVSKIRIEGLLKAGTVEQQGSDFVWTPSGDADGVYEKTFEDSYTVSEEKEALTPVLLVIPQDLSLYQVTVTIDYSDAQGTPSSYTATLSSGSFLSGTVNSYTIKKNSLVHYFSVSADKKVVFAPGNLQFRAKTSDGDQWPAAKSGAAVPSRETLDKHWRFAEHQWDYVGNSATTGTVWEEINEISTRCINSSRKSDYQGWIDAFCWGQAGFYIRNVNYPDPWYDYTGTNSTYYGYFGPNGSVNLSINDKSDWGWLMSEGTDAQWRTLTSDEWSYMLAYNTTSCRSDATKKRGLAQLTQTLPDGTTTTINGLVILPDEFTFPDGLESKWNSLAKTYDGNKFNYDEWNAMEERGVVFLPAVTSAGAYSTSYSYYWTASFQSNSAGKYIGFNTAASSILLGSANRNVRYPVRLVKEIEIQN